MKLKRNLALSDSGFIFNPSSGDSYSTNPIGLEVISMMKNGKSQEEIKKQILSRYMTDEATVEKDLYDFMNVLGKYSLTETDGKKEA